MLVLKMRLLNVPIGTKCICAVTALRRHTSQMHSVEVDIEGGVGSIFEVRGRVPHAGGWELAGGRNVAVHACDGAKYKVVIKECCMIIHKALNGSPGGDK